MIQTSKISKKEKDIIIKHFGKHIGIIAFVAIIGMFFFRGCHINQSKIPDGKYVQLLPDHISQKPFFTFSGNNIQYRWMLGGDLVVGTYSIQDGHIVVMSNMGKEERFRYKRERINRIRIISRGAGFSFIKE